jgi:hypothetical protein
MMFPRGTYLRKRLGGPPEDEAEHFIRCPACDGWIDCRDLACSSTKGRSHTRPRTNRNDGHSVRSAWVQDSGSTGGEA